MLIKPAHIISAIIGMWRCGARVYEIAEATAQPYNIVEMAIEIYKTNLKENEPIQ